MSQCKIEWGRLSYPGMLIGAVFCEGILLLTRFSAVSPHYAYSILSLSPPAPGVVTASLLWTVFALLGGACFGGALAYRGGCAEVYKYKGGMFFVALLAASCAWYPTFFSEQAFFISFLLACLISVCSVLCTLCYARFSRILTVGMALFSFWILLCTVWNFLIIFQHK